MAEIISIDFQQFFIFIFLCLCSLICYSFSFKKPKNSPGCNLPPSPPSLPIIGHLHLLLSSLSHKSLQKISSKYGPLLHIRIFNVPIILVSSASVAEEIFRAHDMNISSSGVAAIDEPLMFGSSEVVYAPYGDYWKFVKKIIATKLLRPQVLERSRGIRDEELQQFYQIILDKARKNENIEIGKEATTLINNILWRMSMGRSFSEENGEAEKVRGLVAESVINAYAVMRNPDSWEDPNEFKPERFLASSRTGQDDEREQAALKYIPFGGGRRGCPGSNLVSVSVGTAVGVMVQCFDWRIEGDTVNMEETFEGLSLTMVHPLKCSAVPRTLPFL